MALHFSRRPLAFLISQKKGSASKSVLHRRVNKNKHVCVYFCPEPYVVTSPLSCPPSRASHPPFARRLRVVGCPRRAGAFLRRRGEVWRAGGTPNHTRLGGCVGSGTPSVRTERTSCWFLMGRFIVYFFLHSCRFFLPSAAIETLFANLSKLASARSPRFDASHPRGARRARGASYRPTASSECKPARRVHLSGRGSRQSHTPPP